MNTTKDIYESNLTKTVIDNLEQKVSFIFGETLSYKSFETNQLQSYKGVEYSYFDPNERLKKHQEEFPMEIENIRSFISN